MARPNSDNDETAYREKVRDLTVWCKDNNLSLILIKTKGMIVDYRKRSTEHPPHSHQHGCSGAVKLLGIHITNKLTRSKHTNKVVKRARQNLSPPRRLK
jgi:hypothetical protein